MKKIIKDQMEFLKTSSLPNIIEWEDGENKVQLQWMNDLWGLGSDVSIVFKGWYISLNGSCIHVEGKYKKIYKKLEAVLDKYNLTEKNLVE